MKNKSLLLLSSLMLISVPFSLSACDKKEEISSLSSVEQTVKTLEIASNPKKTSYVEGQRFSKTGLILKATLEDGSSITPKTSDVVITPNRALQTSDTKVTATYRKTEVDIPITVAKRVLENIVVTEPTNLKVGVGDVYSFSDLIVFAHYNDESDDVELKASEYKLSINDSEVKSSDICSLDEGSYTVLVSYQNKTSSFMISVIKMTVADVTFTNPVSLSFAKGGKYDFTGFEAHATFKEEGVKAKNLDFNRLKFTIGEKEIHHGDVIESDDGTYKVDVTVLNTESVFNYSFDIEIFAGYKIEAEDLSVLEESEILSDSYVRGKAEKNSADYIDYHTDTVLPLSSRNDSLKASAGQYLGEIRGGCYIEFNFKSEVSQKASINIKAASTWLRKDKDWNPLWMGDIQLNEVFKATANETAVNISDEVILSGSGDIDNTETGVAAWDNFESVSFGEMDLAVGWNKVSIEIEPESKLAKYVNSHGSFTIMNIDYLLVGFKK